MDAVNKAQNLTAIIRTADAVGIQRMHATSASDTVRLHHMIAGATKHWVAVTLHRSTRTALAALRAEGWRMEGPRRATIATWITRRRWRSSSAPRVSG
jgi:tRNA (guanosine-2'-O-)-methyltransferase